MQPAFLEYLTANEHIAYPFKEGAEAIVDLWADVAVTGDATITKNVLIDAVIVVPASYAGVFYLQSITCIVANHFTLDIADNAGAVVAAVQVDLTAPPAPRSVIQQTSITAPVYSARLLTGEHFVAYLQKVEADLGIGGVAQFTQRLPFETAAVEFRPARLDKLRFYDYLGVPHDLTGDAALYEGYNLGLVANGGITMEANPGLGAGVDDSGCGPPAPPWADQVVNFNGALADEDGNVNLEAVNCHRFQADPANARILVYNDCEVCCTCQDYANFAKTFDNLLQRLAKVWKGPFYPDPDYLNLATLIQTINAHITEYNSVVFPKVRTVSVWGHVMVGAKIGAAASGANYATVTFVATNRVSDPVTISGVATFSHNLIQVTTKDEGKAGTAAFSVVGNTISFTVTLDPFTEEHLYLLVKGGDLTGLNGQLTATWTQYGVPGSLTVPIV